MPERHKDEMASAVRKLARAIERLAKAHEGNLSEADQKLLASTLSVSEAVTVRLEKFAAVLKLLDEQQ